MYREQGTNQEVPHSMLFCDVALMPLIKVLRRPEKYIQGFSADDAAACANLKLRNWHN